MYLLYVLIFVYVTVFKKLNTFKLGCVSFLFAIFQRVNNFCDFLFAALGPVVQN